MSRVRLKDIAEATGVSIGTVSRILNDSDWRIAESTRQKVRQAAERLGYVPNVAAQSLRTNRTRIIAALTDNVVTTTFAHDMIRGMQNAAAQEGYLLIILGTDNDPTQRARAIELIRGHQVEGLLVASMYNRVIETDGIPAGLPTVAINGVPDVADMMGFAPDDRGGARAATEHLLKRGHRNIVHMTEPQTDGLARVLRIEGFDEAMAGVGATGQVVEMLDQPGLPRSAAAEKTALEVLSSHQRPTAIFAFNDLMAIGVYRAARQLGLDVPRDLSVIGFDDQEFVANEASPPLTTVALPHEAMGSTGAVELLRTLGEAVPGQAWGPGTHLLECPIIERESVASPVGA